MAEECDADVSDPSTMITDCDHATIISGWVSESGKAVFSSRGITLKEGVAYSDGDGGSCSGGDSCDLVLLDADNASFFLAAANHLRPLCSSGPSKQ